MTPLPSTQQLRYLVALGETAHVGRAAARCAVSQSTLSTGIIALERTLDAQILDRSSGRRVVFTPLGAELVERAHTALAALQEIADAADAIRAPLAGQLRLGLIPTIGPFLLPRLVPLLRHTYPGLRLMLREDTSARLLDDLFADRLDLLILAEPYPCGGAETLPVARDEFMVAMPKAHPLAARDAVPMAALSRETMLLLEDGHCLRDHVLAACRTATPQAAFAATSLHTLIHMVSGGLGITLLPRLAAACGIARGVDVALRRLDGAGAWRTISLVFRPGAPRILEYRALWPMVASAIANPAP
ncbi:MAG: hydrogen peroxide-inducible genes activator [Acidiphilium sp.]|nr:hydrogen peroxide-inducible genes activator [Acidiphilium sp.]MDD4936100.1 hydrogen peroxide-inducible genes activator [Acidiphilium sp.]